MSKEKRRVPKLRFPGFTEDWEQRKLGECMSSFAYGLNAAAKDYDGMHKYIRITDIDDETHNFIQSNLTSPDIDFNMDVSDYKLNIGDIVFARTGASVGKTYLYNPNDGDLYYAGFLIRGKVKEDYDAGFIYQNTLTKEYDSFIRITSQRSGQPGVNSKEYATFRLNIPCKDEQEKISKVLNNLDELFTLHQRKLEHLNLKKKALLQKLFPKNGERYPELRFPGFTDAWEQRKLGDFTNQINIFENPEDAKLPLWSLTAEAGLIEKSDRYERDFLVKKKDQFKRIETNTLVYNPMNITIGSIDIYTGPYPIAVSGYYVSIVYDKNIDTNFLKEALLLPSSLKMYKNYATGSLIERQRVQYPTFSKIQLLFPNFDEQKAIGQLFKSLNLNITLHQRKLEHLQLQKKALLQQMFV